MTSAFRQKFSVMFYLIADFKSNMRGQIVFAFMAALVCASAQDYDCGDCECLDHTYQAKNPRTGVVENRGNCLTPDRTGQLFCYVTKDSGCGEASSARFPNLEVNYSLCDCEVNGDCINNAAAADYGK